MSQTKAQLIAPVGIVTTQGVVVTGVMTATSFDGDVVGSATSIISGSNLNLGTVTAGAGFSAFGGDFTGTATGIQTGAAIKVGVFTATSFTGDFTGTATSMMRGTGFEAGTVTSTAANVTYTITVGSKTGGGNAFYIDGVEAPVITLYPGATYTFDQADSTNGDHPLRLATAADAAGGTEYTDGVTVNGTQGTAGAYTRIVVARNAPTPLYYYCTAHSGMGNSINITNQLQGNVTGNVTGSITGLAGSVSSGGNIHVGVMTATSYSGDGSNLAGIAATNFNTQTVTADSSETIIDLADGNCITMNQSANTTVGFASTSAAMELTLIRKPGDDYTISYSTGGVEFDGSDWLAIPDDSDFTFGTSDFTIECWYKTNNISGLSDSFDYIFAAGWPIQLAHTNSSSKKISFWMKDSAASDSGSYVVNDLNSGTGSITSTTKWYHIAVTREGSTFRMFLDGVLTDTKTSSTSAPAPGQDSSIGRFSPASPYYYANGTVSNFRYIKGTALYTADFIPPRSALTNVTNTKLLCCQSDSSTTTAAVIPTGSITAGGDPTAGAETISLGGSLVASTTITWPSNVKWNNDTAPTLISAATSTSERQQFQFVTGDTGLNWYAWEPFKNDPPNLELFSWGSNANSGQLGQNDRTDRSSPTQVGSAGNWQAASGYASGAAGIKSNGTLWAWGENTTGELGQNDTTFRSSPVQVGTNKNWKSLQWGNNTCWALTNSGTMYAWGINPDGQFGAGFQGSNRSSPLQIGESGIWSSIQQAGNGDGAAVKKGGGLWRWGANNHGELGMNDRKYYSSPIQIGTGTWKSFGGGKNFNIAVDGDGKLWSMGRGVLGVLAQNDDNSRSSPTQVGTGTDWASVTGGKYWSAALKTDGTLYTWGVNNNGNLGLNSRLPSDNHGMSSPTQVPGIWSNIRGNNSGFIGGKSDGTMWVWGYIILEHWD